MSKIKAIIFDFDGVIVESMDIKSRAFAFLFKDYPEHVDRIVEFHMLHGGMSRFEKFKYIYNEVLHQSLSEEKSAMLGEQFSKYVYREVVKCPFVKGAKEFLEKYYKIIPLFVVSGTPESEMRSIVKERDLAKYFNNVYGSPDKKKVLNRRILDKNNYLPSNVIFIGDSIDDYEGVKNTGIRFVGRLVDGNPFNGKKVEALIDDIDDLDKYVGDKI